MLVYTPLVPFGDLFVFLLTVAGLVLGAAGLAAAVAVWGWVLADVMRHEPTEGWSKLGWAYAVLLAPPWGALVYLLSRRPDRLREYGE